MEDYRAERLSATRNIVQVIAPADAARLVGQSDVLFLDVRDLSEVEETGKIKGALNVPYDLLESRADLKSSLHVSELTPLKTIIVYGLTSADSGSASAALKLMGFRDVRNMGAFENWTRGGGAVEYCAESGRSKKIA